MDSVAGGSRSCVRLFRHRHRSGDDFSNSNIRLRPHLLILIIFFSCLFVATLSKMAHSGRLTGAFVCFMVAIALVMIFPIYGFGNQVEPYVLGMPFSLFWVVFWIAVEFFAVIAFFLHEDGGETSANDELGSHPQAPKHHQLPTEARDPVA